MNISYKVLARKYRSLTFADVIGQESVVSILKSGLTHDQLSHAFLFTGIQGTGKTTLARILARAFNCESRQGKTIPLPPEPCGECASCKAMLEERHLDVIEMDAASHTSVEGIRELIEGAKYQPVQSQYKIFIIDEVHMLSKSAFNALLKTLEEPPLHVKFIFATTEVRKIPVTIISRCLRFDLRRVDSDTLTKHFQDILNKEGIKSEKEALDLIARSADGSVRDGLSLLEQALTLKTNLITTLQIRNLLCLNDPSEVFQLLATALEGNAKATIAHFHNLYQKGADPILTLQDMLECCYKLSCWVIGSETIDLNSFAGTLAKELSELKEGLSFASLSRVWHVLMKGLEDIHNCPLSKESLEMTLLRLCYLSPMPLPSEIIKQFEEKSSIPHISELSLPKGEDRIEIPHTFADLVPFLIKKGEPLLAAHLRSHAQVIEYKPGNIVFNMQDSLMKDFVPRLRHFLNKETNLSWGIETISNGGDLTLQQQEINQKEEEKIQATANSVVRAVLDTFPESKLEIISVQEKESLLKL